MKKLPAHVLWLDLETTGTKESDEIIEVGCVLTDVHLEERATFSAVTYYPRAGVHYVDPFVQEMHRANGLWVDCAAQDPRRTIETVDRELSEWLKYQTGSDEHVALAGSGVSHFDRKFMDRLMPETVKRLTYWSLDVGVMRRMLQLFEREDVIPTAGDAATKTHRALDDAQQHLEEARHYAAHLGR